MKKREVEKHHVLDDLIDNYLTSGDADKINLLDEFLDAKRNNIGWKEELGEKNEIADKIKKGIDKKIVQINNQKRKKQIVIYMYSAAAILVLMVCFTLLSYNIKQSSTTILTFQTKQTADSIQLADGTMVYLSPNSIFSYPQKFSAKTRNVTLEKGNAFFKVFHNPQKPFVITSGDIKTKVLGTSFNIHINKEQYSVVVHTGKVNVSSGGGSINLLPFHEGVYSKKDNQFKVKRVSAEEINPWYNSDITLTNQSLETILKVVVQKYGIDHFSVNPELLKHKATVFIGKQASLCSVIKQINYITNLKLIANGEKITCETTAINHLKN